jgi:hypothetical protein
MLIDSVFVLKPREHYFSCIRDENKMLFLNINGPLSLKRKENELNNTDKRSADVK